MKMAPASALRQTIVRCGAMKRAPNTVKVRASQASVFGGADPPNRSGSATAESTRIMTASTVCLIAKRRRRLTGWASSESSVRSLYSWPTDRPPSTAAARK